MRVVSVLANVVHTTLLIYTLVLFGRLILEYIPLFNRGWRPRGPMLVVAEAVYTVTDPPLRFLRRRIQPLRLGAIALDLGFPITMFSVLILMSFTRIFM